MKRQQEAGYSLMEMVVAIAILALVYASVAPLVPRQTIGGDTRQLADEIALALAHARTVAMVEGRSATVTFDLDRRVILGPGNHEVAIPDTLRIKIVSAVGETSGNRTSIRFYADGASTGGSITLAASDDAWRLAISWLTGITVLEEAQL